MSQNIEYVLNKTLTQSRPQKPMQKSGSQQKPLIEIFSFFLLKPKCSLTMVINYFILFKLYLSFLFFLFFIFFQLSRQSQFLKLLLAFYIHWCGTGWWVDKDRVQKQLSSTHISTKSNIQFTLQMLSPKQVYTKTNCH